MCGTYAGARNTRKEMMFPVEKGGRNDTSVSKIHATKQFGNN
jgi:hypothetical protein